MKFLDETAKAALRAPKGIFCLCLIAFSLVVSGISFFAAVGMIGQNFAGFRHEPTLTVSAVNEAYWSGPKAGIQTYDRIMAVNGQTIETPEQFEHLIQQTPVGTELEYLLVAKASGEERRLMIAVQTFTLFDFLRSSFFLFFIVGFLHIFVGVIAYLIRPENPASRAHLFMTLAIGVTSTLVSDYDLTMLFPRVWMAAVALTGGACLHLGLYFPQKKKLVQNKPWVVWIPYAVSFGLLGAWQFFFRELGYVGYEQQGIVPYFDLHFMFYDLSLVWSLLVGFMGLIGLIMHSWLRAESRLVANQAKVALLGAVVAYLPMTIFWLIIEQLLHIPISQALATICWLLFLVFPVAVAYAIIKHKMFDIDFVLKQSMTYSALIALLGSLYVALAAGLQQIFAPIMSSNSELTAYMITTAVTILLFEPLKLNIRQLIDTRFFRTKYDFRQALSEFIDAARGTIKVEELTPKLVEVVEKTIHPKHILLFLKNPASNTLQQAYSHGLNLQLKDEIPLDDVTLLAALGLARPKKSLTTRLTGALNLGSLAQQGPLPSPIPFLLAKRITKELPSPEEMEAIQNSLTLPLTVRVEQANGDYRDDIIGLLTLGEKRSEMDYTIEDRQLFQSIGQQLALTLHAAQLAEEVAEKEVIKQTLQKARVIQRSMLPDQEPALSCFEVTGYSESADETGGDYYDWYQIDDQRFIVGVGDVTGHGIDAAMIVSMAKSCLYNQAALEPGVLPVMAALNRTINEVSRRTDRSNRKLMSFVYAYFDGAAMTCKLASAGHWFPYHYRAQTKELTNYPEFKGTFPLGQRPPEKFRCSENEVQLGAGDVLFFFTDGLHEAENSNGQPYDFERIEQLLNWYGHLSAHEIKERFQQDFEQHIVGRGMDDDITLVVVKVTEAEQMELA